LRGARADTRTAAILATCGIPRHCYQMRVQTPEETDLLSRTFDGMVDDVLNLWFDVPSDDVVGQGLLHIPRGYGGVGFLHTHPTRASSYCDSRYKALAALDPLFRESERAPATKAAADDLFYSNMVKNLSAISPLVRRHIEENNRHGASSWIFAPSCKMTPEEYGTAIRARALARSSKLSSRARCMGCRKDFDDQVLFNVHIQGCASNPTGHNSNVKHNLVVRTWMKGHLEYALSAGRLFRYEPEPRDFGEYACKRCHTRGIRPEDVKRHVEISPGCGGDPIHSGPDMEVHWTVADRMVYDYTTLHLTCESKLRCSSDVAVRQVTSDKVAKYVTSGQIPSREFSVIIGYSSGGVGEDLRELLRRLSLVRGVPAETLGQELAGLVQREQARAVISAHRANATRLRWQR